MADYVFFPPKKHKPLTFKISGTLIVKFYRQPCTCNLNLLLNPNPVCSEILQRLPTVGFHLTYTVYENYV
jgi:hypothetical protein